MTFGGVFLGIVAWWFLAWPDSFGRHLARIHAAYVAGLAALKEKRDG